jgi:hypothetical protein
VKLLPFFQKIAETNGYFTLNLNFGASLSFEENRIMANQFYKVLRITFLLISIQLSSNMKACTYAYQYSLFPLGSSASEIIFLELELERYVNTPASGDFVFSSDPMSKNTLETRWKGNLKIKSSIDGISFTLVKELSYIDIPDADYNSKLEPYFEKALAFAKTLPYFEEAILEKTAKCAYDRTCGMFSMQIDTIKSELLCQLPDSSASKQIIFPEILVSKYQKITNLNVSEQGDAQNASKLAFIRLWKPCSARIYRIGDRQLLVYCIGWGQKRGYIGTKDDNWKLNNFPVDLYIEGNDVMMHGQRFDSCVLF